MIKIRLARRGRKRLAKYDVVIANITAPRDGRFIEKIGVYDPNTNPATIDLDEELAFQWLLKGAQPTDTVKAILSYRGILLRKHLQIGVNKGAISPEEAQKRYDEWKAKKEEQINKKVGDLNAAKDAESKARLDAEIKVKEARAETIRKKQEAEENAIKEAEEAKAREAAEKAKAEQEAAEKMKEKQETKEEDKA